jgi:hypothetical protein
LSDGAIDSFRKRQDIRVGGAGDNAGMLPLVMMKADEMTSIHGEDSPTQRRGKCEHF